MPPVIAVERPDQPEVHALLAESLAYSASRYPPTSNYRLDMAALAGPRVAFLVAREDGVAVGCGALYRAGPDYAEVKSMVVASAARGRGIGAALIARIEALARAENIPELRLETGVASEEALRLYARAGFTRCRRFGSYPDDPLSVFLRKPLVATPKIVPELQVRDFARSLAFYTEVIGFSVRYARPEDRFAYLNLDGAHLMIEEIGEGLRHWLTGPMELPFGRGINLQIEVADVDALHARVRAAGLELYWEMEERWYRRDHEEVGNRQFLVQDPDGYLLRFFTDLGARPRTP